ncbi:MAG TPA: GH116 family glycosyl-hydrolase [Fimbriimonas sp.]|nr:GH116 family glycosyl-hydrolase [Fimbriimonas sp.]
MDLFAPSFDLTPYTRRNEHLREVAFPLGGIGTGCVSLDGRGGLRDWEIFGRPNKGSFLDYTFPALWVKSEGSEPKTFTVQGPRLHNFVGDTYRDWDYGHGTFFKQMDGLPGFLSVDFAGTFPFARLSFHKESCPLAVDLAAFNPFIPQDVRSSSFPGLVLVYRLTNRSDKAVEATLSWSLKNPVGESDPQKDSAKDLARNKAFRSGNVQGISFTNELYKEGDAPFGEAALATDWPDTMICERWSVEGWWDSLRGFWNEFHASGEVKNLGKEDDNQRISGTVACRVRLEPGEEALIPFVLTWRFPSGEKYWGDKDSKRPPLPAHYGVVWASAPAAAKELLERRAELTERTLQFENALYNSDLPQPVLESVGNTISILHSPTLIRLENGEFWAWEGCSSQQGCCEGTCSHVWNYALAHAYLFPEIQRSFLNTAFAHGFRCGPQGSEGAMNFRIALPLGQENPLWHAASDGQLGQIIQIYRDWRLTGDDAWVRSIYPLAKRALSFALVQWDRDQDGFVDGDMHNTYDINFCTPNPLTQFFYLGALRSMELIAGHVGDSEFGEKCRSLLASGREKTVAELWNGEFFKQLGQFVAASDPRYQHGAGCLSDQLFGQLSATVAGLGDLVDSQKIHEALNSIYRYNFRSPLGDHENLQRVYAVADEAGLLLCSWPRGETPFYPFVYSDEVWTGIEYQVATHLAFEGERQKALDIAKAIRQRHDGRRRNPWNEFECGSHYARALASYGLMLAWTGCRYDAVDRTLSFTTKPFKGLWSVPGAWGTAERRADGTLDIQVLEGKLPEGTRIA